MREIFKNRRQKRITYQHLDLRDVYRTHSISLCVLSVPLSLCVRVSVRACVCAVLCVSLLLFDEFFVLFQASLVLIFLVDSSSLPISVSSSRTRERLPLFLFCSSRTSPRLSDDFPNDFPTTKGARVLACVLWCWCWCWYSARNEELMKIRARARRDAFESNGTLVVVQKKNKKRFKRKRKETTTNTGPRLSRVVVGRATDRLSRPLFRFFFSFFFSIQIFPSPSLSYKRRFHTNERRTVAPQKRNGCLRFRTPCGQKKAQFLRCEEI